MDEFTQNTVASIPMSSQRSRGSRSVVTRRRRNKYSKYQSFRLFKTPASAVYPFQRSCEVKLTYNPSEGLKSTTNPLWKDHQLAISISLAEVKVTWPAIVGAVESFTVDGNSEFTRLFDQYRVRGCDVKFFYSNPGTDAPYQTATAQALTLYIANDYDDTDNVFNTGELLQYSNLRTIQCSDAYGRIPKHTLTYPKTKSSVQTDPGFDNTALMRSSPWLDSNRSDIEHNGIKIAVMEYAASPNVYMGSLTMVFTLYFDFKFAR